MVLKTFLLLCNHHHHLSPNSFYLAKLKFGYLLKVKTTRLPDRWCIFDPISISISNRTWPRKSTAGLRKLLSLNWSVEDVSIENPRASSLGFQSMASSCVHPAPPYYPEGHGGSPLHFARNHLTVYAGLRHSGTRGKEPICQCRRHPWVEKIPWRREWQSAPVFLPGKFHGQRSLAGYCPWGHKQSIRLKQLSMHKPSVDTQICHQRHLKGWMSSAGSRSHGWCMGRQGYWNKNPPLKTRAVATAGKPWAEEKSLSPKALLPLDRVIWPGIGPIISNSQGSPEPTTHQQPLGLLPHSGPGSPSA